ncbi:MAG: TolC family protein [Desulfobacterales bacterium]
MTNRREKKTHMICLPAMAIVLALGMGGCAGPSNREVGPRTFEQWSREDQRRFALRTTAPAPAARPYPPLESDAMLPDGARLADYVRYAMQHNPDLETAFYRWRAALERVSQERTLPDPRVSFGVLLDQVEESAEYMGERYTLEQMFPWFGKLALGGDMALTGAHAEAQAFEATRLRLVDQVSRAYYEHAYQHHPAMIARENLELLVRLEAVVRTMFRTGDSILADVSRAQMEIGRLDDQVRSLEDLVGVAAAELNAALGRPVNTHLPALPDRPSLQMVPELPEYTDDQWIALAREHNPELRAARHDAEQQRQAIALARKNYYPDITVGVEYARNASERVAMLDEGGADMLSGMVSVNVPIWRKKYDAGLREMQARASQAHRQIDSRQQRLEADLKLALYTHRDSLRKLALYGDTLLPMARQTLATTETAYRTGRAGFPDLIDAQRVLLEFALAHERAAAERAQAFTRIQALVGRLIDGDATANTTIDGEVRHPSPVSPLE